MVLSRRELEGKGLVIKAAVPAADLALPDSPSPAAEVFAIKRQRSRLRDVDTPDSRPLFQLRHPDSTDSDPIKSKFIVALPGRQPVTLRPEFGVYGTYDPDVRDELIRKGFSLINAVPTVQNDPRWEAELKRLKENQ